MPHVNRRPIRHHANRQRRSRLCLEFQVAELAIAEKESRFARLMRQPRRMGRGEMVGMADFAMDLHRQHGGDAHGQDGKYHQDAGATSFGTG